MADANVSSPAGDDPFAGGQPESATLQALTVPLVDIGANMTDPMFRGMYRGSRKHDDDFDLVLQRAWESGVGAIFVTGGSLEESQAAIDMVAGDSRLFCTVGCHPTRCGEFDDPEKGASPEAYEAALKALVEGAPGSVVAVGEAGLDYDRLEFCDKETQNKYFRRQMQLAIDLGLPMFLHNRNTGGDFVAAVSEHAPDLRGVVHSFDGPLEEAQALLNLGFYIGINGCSLKTEENLDVVRALPLDRILLETDAPWCGIKNSHAGSAFVASTFPTKKKAKQVERGWCTKDRSEPCHLVQVLEVVAGARGEDAASLAESVYENTLRLFPAVGDAIAAHASS